MTPFGPFYCSLPLYPQPLWEGRRKTIARGFFAWFVWAYAPTTSEGWCFPLVGAASLRPRHLPVGKQTTFIRLRPAKAVRNHAKNPPSPPTTLKNKSPKKYMSFHQFWFKKIYVWRLLIYLYIRYITLRVGLALRLVWLICRLALQPASMCSAQGIKKRGLTPPSWFISISACRPQSNH